MDAGNAVNRPEFYVGQSFEKSFHFDEQAISIFASAAGDTNPLHHDRVVAERSRFGGIIASGTHYTALMMGLVADYFSRNGEAVGLEFSFQFRKAVPAGSTMQAEWTITEVERSDKLGGHIVHLSGTLKRDQVVHVAALGKALAIQG
ncbi:MaoC family dehydratase [Rhizobium sullae]|uniref:Acyl dehydratase n=1 Tax=Rhizobium sullae TaxID=50338 RepID=A0A4R3QFV8_RHISU|nr:MaoC family dehydratase [Rhizobium sullae]TCU20603.1 acyl dehydratase [Rhizobium sullae]